MKKDRRGQVWEELYDSKSFLFLFIGELTIKGEPHYALLDLETGNQDAVVAWAVDLPSTLWKRLA